MPDETLIQGSPEWDAARLGKITASKISDVLAGGKGITRQKYMDELIVERLTGHPTEGYTSAAMERGKEVEALARVAYVFYKDAEIELVGFVDHPKLKMCGASPDGLIGDDGLVEFKCPDTSTLIAARLGKNPPKTYRDQMQFQMACTEKLWCDLVFFDPRMPENLALFTRRFARDDEYIRDMELAIDAFQGELKARLVRLQATAGAGQSEG